MNKDRSLASNLISWTFCNNKMIMPEKQQERAGHIRSLHVVATVTYERSGRGTQRSQEPLVPPGGLSQERLPGGGAA